MKMNEIIDTIKMLAKSQGFYGKLLNSIMSLDTEDFEKVKTELENQNFKDSIDMIMYFECQN